MKARPPVCSAISLHGGVFGKGLLGELYLVLDYSGGAASDELGSRVGGAHGGIAKQAARIDGVDRDLGSGEQPAGLAQLIVVVGDDRKRLLEISVGKDVKGE